jgi:hypothetical protein
MKGRALFSKRLALFLWTPSNTAPFCLEYGAMAGALFHINLATILSPIE